MINIAHISNVVDGRINSGTARVARELIREIANDSDIHQYLIHFDESSDEIYSLPNCTEIRLEPFRIFYGSRYLSFLRFCLMNKISKKYKFDVVHWHVARIYPFFFLLPTKITIVTIHDAGNYILDNVMNLSNWIFRFNYELFQNKIKKFIVVSNDAKANLVRYSKISEDKISVIYPASRINQVRKEPPADFYDIPKDSNIILCVARWQNHKNVESLIRAYEKFNCDFPDCHLLLVGKEVGTYDLPRKLLKSIPTTRYSVMSDLSDSELAFLYSKAYVNVVPSLHEGFGLSVLEAMMFGCPSIVHKFTSTSEIAGPAGLSVDMRSLFELKSALESILNNEELRTALSQASLIHSKNFSWNYFSNQVLQIYRTPE